MVKGKPGTVLFISLRDDDRVAVPEVLGASDSGVLVVIVDFKTIRLN
jgi:hypothetical protein